MLQIELANGGTALVDDADFPFLNQFEWRAKRSEGSANRIHAVRNVLVGNRKVTIRMHRLITEAGYDQHVYHLNGNGLDNRRKNLQLRTLKPWTGRPNLSGYRGVHQLGTNRWRAEIEFAGRIHALGDAFASPKDAAIAYDQAAVLLYGDFARTNLT